MDFDLSAEVEGVRLRHVRDILKKVGTLDFNCLYAAEKLDISEVHARRLLDALCRDGFIEKQTDGQGYWFRATVRGNALRMSRMWKRIPRAKGDEILARLRERIAAINADSYYLYVISEARAFGSYAEGAEEIGDIDIAVKLSDRPPLSRSEVIEESRARADDSGKAINALASMFYGEEEVRRELQKVSRYISLHSMEQLERLGGTSVALFEKEQVPKGDPRPTGS